MVFVWGKDKTFDFAIEILQHVYRLGWAEKQDSGLKGDPEMRRDG
jgi:hypothetical protein